MPIKGLVLENIYKVSQMGCSSFYKVSCLVRIRFYEVSRPGLKKVVVCFRFLHKLFISWGGGIMDGFDQYSRDMTD